MGYKTTNQFGRAVRLEMERRGVSLRHLARETGLSAGYLSLVINGVRQPPTPQAIESINKALGIDTPRLYWLAKYVPRNDRRYDKLVDQLQYMSDGDIDEWTKQLEKMRKQRRQTK